MLAVLLIVVTSGCTDHTFDLEATTKAQAVEILRQGLEDDEFWPSIHAAEGLILSGLFRRRYDLCFWPNSQQETDDQRRCGLARELVRAGDAPKIQILADVLSGEDDYAHIHAAEGLYKIGEIGNAEAMMRAFESTDNNVLHLMAAGALTRQGDDVCA